jgi:DNA polymerase-3 subunit gamma/tau
MPYEPLHHKYRPQTFADLVGQEAIATTLTNAIEKEKIAPAYLFTGPRGTGKTSSARILAKSLNCLKSNKPTAQPCGACAVCQGIANGSALDVIEIDAASNTGVDNIREIIERAQFAPVQCRYKVYCIDECHMLSTAAFNALLKTLEEPPAHVVFVLATTDPQRVLPTIISRCQRFDFRRIPLEAMVTHLSAIALKENIDIAPEAVHLVASFAQGGLRDAESLLDQLSLLSGQVTVDSVWDLVGSVAEPDLLELLAAIAQNHPEALLDRSRRIMDRGKEPLTLLQNLASFYRDLLIAKTAPNRKDLVTVTPLTWKTLCEQAKSWDIGSILAGQQHLAKSEVQIKNTTQPRLWLEVALLGLLPFTMTAAANITPAQPNRQLQQIDGRKEPQSQPKVNSQSIAATPSQTIQASEPVLENSQPIKQVEPSTPVEEPTRTEEFEIISPAAEPIAVTNSTDNISTEEVWQQILAQLQPNSRREPLRHYGQLISFDGSVARIGIRAQFWYNMAKKEYLPNIREAFRATFQQEVEIRLELTTTPAKNSSIQEPLITHKASVSVTPASSPSVASPATATKPNPTQIPQQQADTQGNLTASHSTPLTDLEPSAATTVDWDDDEVAIASQRLADFFKGEVVGLKDDAFTQSTAIAPPTDSQFYEADELDEADIGF